MLLTRLLISLLSTVVASSNAQSTATTESITSTSTSPSSSSRSVTPTTTSKRATSGPPDVVLNVPKLKVGRIELDVDNLVADINLGASIAQLVQINAGVQISIQKVKLTVTDVDAQLQLVVRLQNLVEIVNRVFSSLDLNPLLLTAVNNVTSVLSDAPGAVDGLLGSVTQNGNTLNFLVDNLGNIQQQVVDKSGNGVNTIVGNYAQNMTFTGQQKTLTGGQVQKTYSYTPLNAIVNIVFNPAGQIVQSTVQKRRKGGGS